MLIETWGSQTTQSSHHGLHGLQPGVFGKAGSFQVPSREPIHIQSRQLTSPPANSELYLISTKPSSPTVWVSVVVGLEKIHHQNNNRRFGQFQAQKNNKKHGFHGNAYLEIYRKFYHFSKGNWSFGGVNLVDGNEPKKGCFPRHQFFLKSLQDSHKMGGDDS